MYHKPSSLSFYDVVSDKKAEGQDIITVRHHRAHQGTKTIEGRKLGSKNLKLFIFICGKDIPKACFYRTLDLNRIRNLNRRRHFIHSMNMKREELSGVGKKVLPISEASLSKTTERNSEQYCVTAETKDRTKGDRNKLISRMKELLRRVAATKTDERESFYDQKVIFLNPFLYPFSGSYIKKESIVLSTRH